MLNVVPINETGRRPRAAPASASTALLALECAIHLQDWGVASEAYVMLEDALKRVIPIATLLALKTTPANGAH